MPILEIEFYKIHVSFPENNFIALFLNFWIFFGILYTDIPIAGSAPSNLEIRFCRIRPLDPHLCWVRAPMSEQLRIR